MRLNIQNISIALLLVSASLSAQKKDENIGTEVVNVVKPYTPTISDAFKVKETPTLEDDPDNAPKENIEYQIFSFPVASTFTPSKGRAASVEKSKRETLYKNYATLGGGNYGTILGELYVTHDVTDTDFVSGMLRHHSSAGNIKGTELDDNFINSSIDLTYGSKMKEYSWNADAGYQYQGYNWYGLPEGFGDALTADYRKLLIESIDPRHTYHNAYLGGRLAFNDSFFDEMTVKYNRFWDTFDAAENRLVIKPRFGVDLFETHLKINLIVDHVSGEFNDGFGNAFPYSFTNLGAHPSLNFKGEDWSLDLGGATYYSMNGEANENKLRFYPKIAGSLKIVGDLMVFYAGADGDLQQNSYRDFTNENPYMASMLAVGPTDRQFDIFAGLKGKLASSVSYNIRGSYMRERERALFRATDIVTTTPVARPYEYGNSFGVVYDRLRTIGFFGELKADFTKSIAFGINGTFNTYNTDEQAEAWNLPQIRIGSSLDVDITQKWYAGAQIFFVGERKDFQDDLEDIDITPGIVTLKSYFDANAHVGYKHNDRLTAFVRANNIANQVYQKWLNYNVQGFQLVLGASYKFDF